MTGHLHQADCLVVDLDRGVVGEWNRFDLGLVNLGGAYLSNAAHSSGSALLPAISHFNGQTTSPHYKIDDAAGSSLEQAQRQVWDAEVWCAVVATEGATARYEAAIAPGSATGEGYDPTQAYTHIGVQARYPTVWSSMFLPAVTQVLTSAARAFADQTVAPTLANATRGQFSPTQIGILLNPVGSTFLDLAPFRFSNTPLLNTIGILLPQLMQSFFLLGLNGFFLAHHLNRFPLWQLVRDRVVVGSAWTAVSSLSVTGWTLAWHESWSFPAKNFFALWAVNWVRSQPVPLVQSHGPG